MGGKKENENEQKQIDRKYIEENFLKNHILESSNLTRKIQDTMVDWCQHHHHFR